MSIADLARDLGLEVDEPTPQPRSTRRRPAARAYAWRLDAYDPLHQLHGGDEVTHGSFVGTAAELLRFVGWLEAGHGNSLQVHAWRVTPGGRRIYP